MSNHLSTEWAHNHWIRVPTFFLSWNSLTFRWLFQYFYHFSPTFFPRLENANYIYLWLQMRLLFQAKTTWRQLKYIKMLCLPQYVLIMNMFFHNVELILNKTMSGNNCFLDFPHKIIILFSDLIFPDFSRTDRKIPWLFPDFLVKF